MLKVIVTGGAGFIGSHLTDRLVELGHQVIIIDNLLLGKKIFINERAKFIKADIRNYPILKKLFKGAKAVFHLAADPRLPLSIIDPVATNEINVLGTLNVLMAAKENKVNKVIFSSSAAVYGNQRYPFKESFAVLPLSPYGLQKLMAEEYCRMFSKLYGLPTVCLRYFNVFGPRKLANGGYPMVIPIFLNQKKHNKPLTIVGSGKDTRDYVYVGDVVTANIKAWHSAVNQGEAINIGSHTQTSVNQIAKLIGGARIHIPPRPGEMKKVEANNALAKNILKWRPTINIEQGIKMLKKEWGVN